MSGQREKKLENMLCLDVFLMSLNPKSATAQKLERRPSSNKHHQLLCRDVVSWDSLPSEHQAQGQIDSHERRLLRALSERHQWDQNIDQILNSQKYEALVLTDKNQVIRWVDLGFYKMTGYTTNYAIGRYPKFLQGRNTSAVTRECIRMGLKSLKPFTEVIMNQRKNKEEYKCEITIHPLFDKQQQVTHFLALENELT